MRPVTDIVRKVAPFEVVSDFAPSGDQPEAIEDLERRVEAGERNVVLLGATGTGKTATTAWLVEQLQRPTLVIAPNKTLAAQFANELRRAAARQRGRILRLLLRLLPARGLRPADRHLHREGLLDQRGGRAAAALGHQLPADPARRRSWSPRCPHLRPGHPAGIRRPDGPDAGRRGDRARPAAPPAGRHAVRPQRRWRSPAAPSGSAATRSRSSRSTRSWPSGSSSSATRSSGCPPCTR